MADVRVSGKLNFTMQQQWIARNCELGGGVSYFDDPPRSVNFVFVGTEGSPAPTSECTNSGGDLVGPAGAHPSPQQLVVGAAPVSVEKPFITVRAAWGG